MSELRISKILVVCSLALFSACSTAPRLSEEKVRNWSDELGREYPQEKSVIARYKKNDYELFYLAARHTSTVGDPTMNLVQTLFDQFKFKVLLIESIPFSSGESPAWFLKEAQAGRGEKFIKGGESSLAVILADQKGIPFFAGEPDHKDLYLGLKSKGYSDLDFIGFYLARQIPQWIREQEPEKDLLKRKTPKFTAHYCRLVSLSRCPDLLEIMNWYKEKNGKDLTLSLLNEEVAPYESGTLFTQRMSADIGKIRDRFTLKIIKQLLQKYKKVAVVYGAGHFLTLRHSFDFEFGEPSFVEEVQNGQ